MAAVNRLDLNRKNFLAYLHGLGVEERNVMDMLDKIMQYEEDGMDEAETKSFFQELVNTGLAWQLQGHYGRTAVRMLEAGLIEASLPRL
jgi:hypothetical protein